MNHLNLKSETCASRSVHPPQDVVESGNRGELPNWDDKVCLVSDGQSHPLNARARLYAISTHDIDDVLFGTFALALYALTMTLLGELG